MIKKTRKWPRLSHDRMICLMLIIYTSGYFHGRLRTIDDPSARGVPAPTLHQSKEKSNTRVNKIAESDPASRNIEHGHHAAHRVCVVVRTHSVQADVLPITLLSLTHQSYEGADVETSIFVVNTDAKGYSESDFMHAAAADANGKAGRKVVSVLDASFHRKPPREGFFGYDVTDHVLEHLLYGDSGCTHFLFTNGDNTYLRSFIERITPAILEGKQLIAWDFLTHHKCGRKCDKDSNVIKVDFVRKHLDLGSVVVGRRAIEMQKPPARFLDRRSETIELFTRDFYFFKRIYDHIGKENVSIIHQVLFVHQ